MSQLDALAQCNAILLAEAIGWLHDYRKCSDEQLQTLAANMSGHNGLPRPELTNRFPTLNTVSISLLGESCSFPELLHRRSGMTCNVLPGYLSRCHYTAHFDKQDLHDEQDPHRGKQDYPDVYISSPFGFERVIPSHLTNQLWNNIPWGVFPGFTVSNRTSVSQSISALFSHVGADTRRPINEIALWDWGMLVSALYKAAIAGALLGHQPAARDLRWRLLSIRVDGLTYTLDALRLPDILARQAILLDGLDKVRQLLEETYPIANEVYCDENGSIYVVADLPDFLDNYTNSRGDSLRELILQAFEQGTLKNDRRLGLGGEIVPKIELDLISWWGQDPDWQTKQRSDVVLQNEIPPIGNLLSQPITSYPNSKTIEGFWKQHAAEVCAVCGLRPQGPGNKARTRKVCDVCEERRLDRSLQWTTEQVPNTIWIDEVADTNARVAFVTGHFNLARWLDGTLVESLVLISPTTNGSCEVKTPSFSRIRRIWKTTQEFWQEVRAETFAELLSDGRRRLLLWLDQTPDLSDFHVYDLDVGRTTLSVVWYPPQLDGSGGYLISADNLGYIADQLGAEQAIYNDPAAAAIWVEDYIKDRFVTESRQPILYNPDASVTERKRDLLAGREIVRTARQEVAYSTAIPILAEPHTFMALVPADRAVHILRTIRTKYEREMGKVRNRLSLHIGVVYFHRRTPLRAALDAGRRMLKQKPLGGDNTWKVQETPQLQADNTLLDQALKQGTNQFDRWCPVKLVQGSCFLTWCVPALMGDGKTEDDWYPYVFIKADRDGNIPTGRTRAFKGLRPMGNKTEECWLVHAAELQEGDQVYFTPATFDFEWLDTASRRFTIAYDDAGKRYGRLARPYLLDQLQELEKAWKLLDEKLSNTQIHALRDLIETKREMWFDRPEQSLSDDAFQQFCHDVLTNAQWEQRPKPVEFQQLIAWAVSGLLTDTIELYLSIMKERPTPLD